MSAVLSPFRSDFNDVPRLCEPCWVDVLLTLTRSRNRAGTSRFTETWQCERRLPTNRTNQVAEVILKQASNSPLSRNKS